MLISASTPRSAPPDRDISRFGRRAIVRGPAVLSGSERVAAEVLDAVEAGRPHVVLPRRMTPVVAFGWIPRRVGDLALLGVPRR